MTTASATADSVKILIRAGLAPSDATAVLASLAEATAGVAVADAAAQTSVASVGVPTKVEFDKTVADITALRTTLNALLASLRTPGVLLP